MGYTLLSHLEACCQIEQQECVGAQLYSQHLQINKTRSKQEK